MDLGRFGSHSFLLRSGQNLTRVGNNVPNGKVKKSQKYFLQLSCLINLDHVFCVQFTNLHVDGNKFNICIRIITRRQ